MAKDTNDNTDDVENKTPITRVDVYGTGVTGVNIVSGVSKTTGYKWTALELVLPMGLTKFIFLDKAEMIVLKHAHNESVKNSA